MERRSDLHSPVIGLADAEVVEEAALILGQG